MYPEEQYVSPFLKHEREGYAEEEDIRVDRVYYINLDRAIDRNKHFIAQCKREHVPESKLERYAAIDGTTYAFSDAEKAMFTQCDYRNEPFAPKIMGNQLSHYRILQDMIAKGYQHILVFQDDAVLRRGFVSLVNKTVAHLPHDAELVSIGFHAHASNADFVAWDLTREDDKVHLIKKAVNPYVGHLWDGINPCSLAYLVTNRGARALVRHFETHGFRSATDWNYNRYLLSKRIFYGSTTVLVTGNATFESSIF